MKLKIKYIDIVEDDFDSYTPRDPYHFGIWLEFEVEDMDSGGTNLFNVFVCSPSWVFSRLNRKPEWGKSKLFLLEYNRDEVVKKINMLIDEIAKVSNSIDEAYLILSRYANWEFENYGKKINLDLLVK